MSRAGCSEVNTNVTAAAPFRKTLGSMGYTPPSHYGVHPNEDNWRARHNAQPITKTNRKGFTTYGDPNY